MKIKTLKKITVVLVLATVCSFAAGCGRVKVKDALDRMEEQEEPTVKNDETQGEISGEDDGEVRGTEPADEDTAGETVNMESSADLSGNWNDMQFVLEGKTYQLPMSYKELEAAGWSFQLTDYGYDDGYSMSPGDKVIATIDLTNPNYSDKLALRVGFKNFGDSVVDIMECDIWSVKLDTCYGSRQIEGFPNMMIGNGLVFGSTREEVESACGPCDDIYETTGYAVYSYHIDYTYYLKVTVYDDLGVTAFELSTHE